MKKIELLAPAGNMECLKAAVMAGCDAVYLGGSSFGARAFSKNFSNSEIVDAITYCHLYGVKVYVTINTLVYENEVDDFLNYVDFLHKNNVDAVLIQDFGMFDLVRKTYPNLEIHCSTQMHIHNLDGTLLMEKLGAKRVVLARETSFDDIKFIKENSSIELEVFVHGALCISYSGQCLMSSLIGGRSGNRGTCAGSCRLKYDVVDENNNKLNKGDYPLSTKDLNVLEHIGKLIDIGVSSLKIEGRMKSKEYVYMVVSMYRKAIDSYYKNKKVFVYDSDLLNLKKIFNRDYTKGFLMNADNSSITNEFRPNHMGVKIGKVINYCNGFCKIKLFDDLYIGSGLRVIGKNDIGINVNNFYINNKLVKHAKKGDIISIGVKEKVCKNADVLITLDKHLNEIIDNIIDSNPRKILINGYITVKLNEIKLKLSDGINEVCVFSNNVFNALNNPITKEDIFIKINKLNDTIYKFDNLNIDLEDNLFIPLKELNDLRRKAILLLNEKRLYKIKYEIKEYNISIPNFKNEKLKSCFYIDKFDSKMKFDCIYSYDKNNIFKYKRVVKKYDKCTNLVMIGEIGGLYRCKNVYTDFSLNVTNSYTVAFLHSLGAKRITLSYELNDDQIYDIISSYHKRYNKHPNLELIVYGFEEVMVCKFSLNKLYNSDNLFLRDRFNNLFKIREIDDFMYIYNYKKRDNFSEKYYDMGINCLRFNL